MQKSDMTLACPNPCLWHSMLYILTLHYYFNKLSLFSPLFLFYYLTLERDSQTRLLFTKVCWYFLGFLIYIFWRYFFYIYILIYMYIYIYIYIYTSLADIFYLIIFYFNFLFLFFHCTLPLNIKREWKEGSCMDTAMLNIDVPHCTCHWLFSKKIFLHIFLTYFLYGQESLLLKSLRYWKVIIGNGAEMKLNWSVPFSIL